MINDEVIVRSVIVSVFGIENLVVGNVSLSVKVQLSRSRSFCVAVEFEPLLLFTQSSIISSASPSFVLNTSNWTILSFSAQDVIHSQWRWNAHIPSTIALERKVWLVFLRGHDVAQIDLSCHCIFDSIRSGRKSPP